MDVFSDTFDILIYVFTIETIEKKEPFVPGLFRSRVKKVVSVLSGCHVDTTLIYMHNTPKISAEGHGYPLRVGPR